MSADEWGSLQEPTLAVPPGESKQSRPARRADGSSPGAWDEDLGRWGQDAWNLPGFGKSGNRCGEWYPEAACDECGHVDFGTHKCGRRSCPDCWGIWAKEAAVRGTRRIQAFRHTQPDDHHRQVAHAVVAPPEGEIMNERQFYDGRKRAADIAKEKGFRGCAVISHPWRVTESGKQEYRDAVERDDNGNPVAGIWVWLRNEFSEKELRERIYWSPHYHIIGMTSTGMEPGQKSDEWVYEFIRSLESYNGTDDRESHEDLYGVFRYLLSHTGFPESSTKQAVTWYGDLANSVFVEDASEPWQVQKPSQTVRNLLEDEIEAIAGVTIEDDESGVKSEESDHMGECPCDDCGGVLIDVFEIGKYLRQVDPPPDVRKAMRAARDWRLGHREPPPGMKRPQTKEQAQEALEELL